ncbi:MAG: hypothetical protein M1326_07315, partial [Cyanobacteria bacterium]|nr:hypothetical protein [Cyanobacteriota bacterium]
MAREKLFFGIILIAFLFRMGFMFLSFQFRENTDILRYKDWGRISFLYGPADTYNSYHLSFGTLPNNQPPGSLYIINSMYFTQIQASKILMKIFNFSPGEIPWINIYLPDIFLRIPSIFADILIGLIIYNLKKIIKSKRRRIKIKDSFMYNDVNIKKRLRKYLFLIRNRIEARERNAITMSLCALINVSIITKGLNAKTEVI